MKSQLILASFLVLFAACGLSDQQEAKRLADSSYSAGNYYPPTTEQTSTYEKTDEAVTDSISAMIFTRATALIPQDSTRDFIRKAELRFRVKEVTQATYAMESAVVRLGGYVENTTLSGQTSWEQDIRVSEDSALHISHYIVTNDLTVRVPASRLDSFLLQLAPWVEQFDHRNVTLEDITYDQLEKRLAQQRLNRYQNSITGNIMNNAGQKGENILRAADMMLNGQAQADQAYVEMMKLKDQVEMATVNISIYQKEKTQSEMIAWSTPVKPYEPGIGSRMAEAFEAGLKGLGYLLSGIVLLWPLWILGAAVLITLRRYRRKHRMA